MNPDLAVQTPAIPSPLVPDSAQLAERFQQVRHATARLAAPLQPEDCVIQSMPDVSPTRWHLAHTTWFFETFVLRVFDPAYTPVNPAYDWLFNSYYNSIGAQFPRTRRGLLSRPTVAEVLEYRAQVEAALLALLERADAALLARCTPVIEIGCQHEEQHQELILTDIKHVFAQNPLYPAYSSQPLEIAAASGRTPGWVTVPGGVQEIGWDSAGFAFDNERPRHKVWQEPAELSTHLITNGDYLEFIDSGGYRQAQHWLSLGWDWVQREGWQAPLYWIPTADGWQEFTLQGLAPLDLALPVRHVSYFEAEAYARWRGMRLPTEAEWELAQADPTFQQATDTCWQWTQSSYSPYPGYVQPAGAIGEYNGKFMCNQYVLRGGSLATPPGHVRPTYRNFFPPESRWQFSGIRLARTPV